MTRRRVAILGSTGSIGTQALDVIAAHPQHFEVVGLAAGENTDLLAEQARTFSPKFISCAADGPQALIAVAAESGAQVLLAATDGFVAFDAIFAAVERGIDIALANKELIVAAGEILIDAAKLSGSKILPVDSEHSAIFQCLVGEDPQRVQSIVLTASGGPFWRKSVAELADVRPDQALAHPTWQMGTKNTIDSATMMNKGLEVIEACRLFDLPPDRVKILVHPQSIAHGFVIFTDGNVKAQLAPPDMRLPIGYALAYPDRLSSERSRRGDALGAIGGNPGQAAVRYDFELPDCERFPCVRLAYEAAQARGTLPTVLSAANEIAVIAFLEGAVSFTDIPALIEKVMAEVPAGEMSIAGVRQADREARALAQRLLASEVTW
ncbi:MAG: 1-deoxy-D-xylulose-5-phosphate reductoisomerase [Candidatus Eremiobacteraeota bacterium]|nr:1-deoxy-D-xylulose-5-phosphate reductoisomerase [Candidatus Eremiobacteraeota bacterium]